MVVIFSGCHKWPCIVAHLLLNARGGVKSSSAVFFLFPGAGPLRLMSLDGRTSLLTACFFLAIIVYRLVCIRFNEINISFQYISFSHFIHTAGYLMQVLSSSTSRLEFVKISLRGIPSLYPKKESGLTDYYSTACIIGLARIIQSLTIIWLRPVALTINFGHVKELYLTRFERLGWILH